MEGRLRADRSGAPLSNLGLRTNAPKILAITTVLASVTVDYNSTTYKRENRALVHRQSMSQAIVIPSVNFFRLLMQYVIT